MPPHRHVFFCNLVFSVLVHGYLDGYHPHHGHEKAGVWFNRWIVEIKSPQDAQILAGEIGLRLEEIDGFPDLYLLETTQPVQGRNMDLTRRLLNEFRVDWAEQQFHKIRVKRENLDGEQEGLNQGPLDTGELEGWNQGPLDTGELEGWNQGPLKMRIRGPLDIGSNSLRGINQDIADTGSREILQTLDEKSIPETLLQLWEEEESLAKPEAPTTEELFNDELWDHQWYLHDTRSMPDLPDISLHVVGVWKKGFSGSGVRVVVLDDGLDYTHPDLAANYDPALSYDFNNGDVDPMPKSPIHSHGTRCAGEISMLPNNHLCGVGVAFNSTIGGVRLLDGKISDELEGKALSWALDKVDIFSSSWGPDDDGQTVEGPGTLASRALERGAREGRGGKGVIYVWASGNGGSNGDDCNCDGYTASIYTLSVSSASQQGYSTWYGESCPSTLTSAYSSGAYTDQKITTTDFGGGCTVSHTGTSAAAPLAAGVVALVLEANNNLTWRDVQYLTVYTSVHTPLFHNDGWRQNGAGLHYNPSFGFGVLNAESMVDTAQRWTNVPPSTACTINNQNDGKGKFRTGGDVLEEKFRVDSCSIKQLEHVQMMLSITHPRRGHLDIFLRSPMGTSTRLLSPRPKDTSNKGFYQWAFMSVELWGENPEGTWTLYIADRGGQNGTEWKLQESRLILRGIVESRLSLRGIVESRLSLPGGLQTAQNRKK